MKSKKRKEQRIIDSAAKRKEVEKKLLNHAIMGKKEYLHKILRDPSLKFIMDAAIIHSTDDKTYPGRDDNDESITTWYKIWFYDLTNEGIEFLTAPYINVKIAIDTDTRQWRIVKKDNLTYESEIVIKADYIGVIPYFNIILINEDGDDYFSEPHIYCRFEYDNTPFIMSYLKYRKLNINFEDNKPIRNPYFQMLLEEKEYGRNE